jgi:hypothetical protein
MVERDSSSKIDPSGIIDLGDLLPFRLGIMELRSKYQQNQSLYRLILFKRNSSEHFLTKEELTNQMFEKEKERAEKEKERAEIEHKKVQELEQQLKLYLK